MIGTTRISNQYMPFKRSLWARGRGEETPHGGNHRVPAREDHITMRARDLQDFHVRQLTLGAFYGCLSEGHHVLLFPSQGISAHVGLLMFRAIDHGCSV